MPKLAANLSLMFNELPFLDRFRAAADAGFGAVEFMFPYDFPIGEVARACHDSALEVVLFNMPAGDWAGGERGLAALPGREAECQEGISRALEYADALNCGRLHMMAGITAGLHADACRETLTANLTVGAAMAQACGREVLIEPINSRVDMPGYFYDTTAAAMAILENVGAPNVRLQYDIYHMQIMEGDLARTIAGLLPYIGHIQLADNPGRAEPGTGEINFPWLLSYLDTIGYEGFVGCEYRPQGGTVEGLRWAERYLAKSTL